MLKHIFKNTKNIKNNKNTNTGGIQMFKTITAGAKMIGRNVKRSSKVAQKIEDKSRERKVAKIMKQYDKESNKSANEKAHEKIDNIINRLEQEERRMQQEEDMQELMKLTGLSKEELDATVYEMITSIVLDEKTDAIIREEQERVQEIK